MRRQFAFVRRMPPCSDRPSSFSRRLRNSHAASPRSFSQHFGVVWSQHRKMWRFATGTPIVAATARCESDAELIRIPVDTKLAWRRHVANERRGGDDGRAGEIAFATESHAVLPVAIERRDRALTSRQGVGTLAEARPAPRLADGTADGSKDVGDRLAVEPRIRPLDLAPHAAGARKD